MCGRVRPQLDLADSEARRGEALLTSEGVSLSVLTSDRRESADKPALAGVLPSRQARPCSRAKRVAAVRELTPILW